CRVALVTDRCGQEPVEGARRWLEIGAGALRPSQVIEVAGRGRGPRPHLLERRAIARVPVHLGGKEDQLARTVVLGDRIGAAAVDATWDLAAGELVRGVPVEILGGDLAVAEPEQGLRHHRAIAYPRARVGSRARSERRAIAADEDMGQRGAQG